MRTRTNWCKAAVGCVVVSGMTMLTGCSDSGGSSPPAAKPVVTISTVPSSVVGGSIAAIQWSTTDASNCIASGEWYGARPISGSENYTSNHKGRLPFTLSCTGAGGTTTNTAHLTVLRGISPP